MNELQDIELIQKIKTNNQPAFEVVFLRYYAALCQYAYTILGSKDAGEEVVQDIFVKLWEHREKLDISGSIKSYLYRTVHNQCINQIQSWKVRNEYSKKLTKEAGPEYFTITPFADEYPIANLIARELEDKITESINALPEQCREVFLLIRVHNNSYQEVANKLNISLNTVKTQMHRAIVKLREMLHDYLPVMLPATLSIFF
jgi:RNA polymerase sigma-70 factor (ECF subfamily)